ncbi:MAG: MotA/TolQ/ExbB proton channel family protein [Kiritimatiellaeota bacterium]|nr:MotA/TolQ/ExbB proton channel family protein [Kiritimatiellota bacterium]
MRLGRKTRKCCAVGLLAGTIIAAGLNARAEEKGAAEAPKPPAAETKAVAETASAGPSFMDVVFRGGIVNTIIWLMIFGTSAATAAFIIDAMVSIKRSKLLPDDVIEGVRQSLDQGELDAAIETCEANPGPLSNILMGGFSNITEGYEVIQEAVASTADMESERLMQRVNFLNLCGQIAPMLGLMGTVTGMVRAFASLGGAAGAARAKLLAMSISTALWTTAVGLLIAVPALLAYTLVRNYATRLVLETEATVLDLIKVLRNAEVEEDLE